MMNQAQDGYQSRFMIRLDRIADRTSVRLEIPAARVFSHLRAFNFPNYSRACRESLYRVASQESIEILVWSIDWDWERQIVVHSVYARGLLYGTLPLRITRALGPPPGYWQLDFLERAIRKGWPVEPFLRTQAESQRLKRHDRYGKSLAEHIPEQLLARALTETNWPLLISPSDSPWAYMNRATRRIYGRKYKEISIFKHHGNTHDQKLEYEQIAAGDELHIEDFQDVCRAAGLSEDLSAVLLARAQGKKWRELPKYLSNQTGELVDARMVEAGRGKLRRLQHDLRVTAFATSGWKPQSASGTVYRERVPDGAPWGGLWTYAHKYQGEELEILGDLARDGLRKLIREK